MFDTKPNHWHRRFLGLAQHISTWSKDGSTCCGAVIVRPNKSIASLGFNGFPQGIEDNPTYLNADHPQHRIEKLKRVIHAEMNALLFLPERMPGLVMYVWPMVPCHRCAVHIIQAGIAGVVAPKRDMPDKHAYMDVDLSRELFKETFVNLQEIEYEPPLSSPDNDFILEHDRALLGGGQGRSEGRSS